MGGGSSSPAAIPATPITPDVLVSVKRRYSTQPHQGDYTQDHPTQPIVPGSGVLPPTSPFLKKLYSQPSSFAGLDPQHALHELLAGNQRFILGHSKRPHQSMQRLLQEANGQTPFAAVLTCGDSRAPPELFFDQGFGDLFVCRGAGNFATYEQIGSLEYAVWHLGVKVVLVLGHTSCGAIAAAIEGRSLPGYIDVLINHLQVPIERTRYECGRKDVSDQVDAITRHNVLYQVERAMKSRVIANQVEANRCVVLGGIYDIRTGLVTLITPAPNTPGSSTV